MTDKLGQEPAFPCPVIGIQDGKPIYEKGGLTKREWFAGMAMTGLCANPHNQNVSEEHIREWAYRQADAMLKEAEKNNA